MKKSPKPQVKQPGDALWHKNAIIYQVHVKTFFDSNGDGIGDFPGLTQKLDYIAALGVNTIWLLPFYPSPLRDDGYDISDYCNVHPGYGTLADFRCFLKEAHQRHLRVITELVINHTSDSHPWFQASRRAPKGSAKRNYYVWSDDDKRFSEVRIIFRDTETSNWAWDPVAQAYYWHRFFSHQPDLNFNNPQVVKLVLRVMRFWLDLGVDGLRLDAIPYLCVAEGTSCENLPQTHEVIKLLRRDLDQRYQDRIFLAEANQWPEDVSDYFGTGDECHMAYHFPLMPRMYMALALEDRHPIVEIMRQTPDIPSNCQWAIFLRNHDELTLEMVTSKERDYMYQAYASDTRAKLNLGIRRRLAPLMENNRAKLELMNALLLSMPGSPIIYYGDEIGIGDNLFLGDRNGVRTPMQWTPDRNGGFSTADPESIFPPSVLSSVYGFQSVNVEAQGRSPSSLLNWMRRLIKVRKNNRAFGEGSLEFLDPANRAILAYIRTLQETRLLCVANLSRVPQPVHLDLARFKGLFPVEMLGGTLFPVIGKGHYQLSLPGYGFYWFELSPQANGPAWQQASGDLPTQLPVLAVKASVGTRRLPDLAKVLEGRNQDRLTREVIPQFLRGKRWFSGKGRTLAGVTIDLAESASLPGCPDTLFSLFSTRFSDGTPQTYFLPLVLQWEKNLPEAGGLEKWFIAKVRQQMEIGFLVEAAGRDEFCGALLQAMSQELEIPLGKGLLRFSKTKVLESLLPQGTATVRRPSLEQSHTSVILGEKLILKIYRQVHDGVSLEVEMGSWLTEKKGFPYIARVAGAIEYIRPDGGQMSLGILQELVDNQDDGWKYTLKHLDRFLELCLIPREKAEPTASMEGQELFLVQMETLGTRLGGLHACLAEPSTEAAFAPEIIADQEWNDLVARIESALLTTIAALDDRLDLLSEELQPLVAKMKKGRNHLIEKVRSLKTAPAPLTKTRCHGDLHLGQVLLASNDFVIIDFEGEPMRPLAERRRKHSPIRDVAGMVRSFSYAAHMALRQATRIRPESKPMLAASVAAWEDCTVERFLKGYFKGAGPCPALPPTEADFHGILSLFCLEKALYECSYELDHRPDWVEIPLAGLVRLLGVTPMP